MNHKARLSVIAVTGTASLALLLTGCGDSSKDGSPQGTSGAARDGDCPDKHSATVPNGNDFGGQVTFDQCKTPKTYDGTAVKWGEIRSSNGSSGDQSLNYSTKEPESAKCYTDPSGATCLPKAGYPLKLVCKTTGYNGSPQVYYGVLMVGDLFHPTRLMDGATHEDTTNKNSAADHFTNDGDTPIGYIKAELVKTSATPSACDGKLLHSKSARQYAMMNGDIPRED